jgi:hypothetical protein
LPVGNGVNDSTRLAWAGVMQAIAVNNVAIAILVFNSSSSAARCGTYTGDCAGDFPFGSLRTANTPAKLAGRGVEIRDEYA